LSALSADVGLPFPPFLVPVFPDEELLVFEELSFHFEDLSFHFEDLVSILQDHFDMTPW
jgi:hypothetical protein